MATNEHERPHGHLKWLIQCKLWGTEQKRGKKTYKNVQFTKPFEFKGSRTLTRTLIVHFCFSIWHSRTFKCWFQRNSFMNVCTVWKTSEKTRSSSFTPKAAGQIWIVWWPLNSFHFLQATASKTLIYLLQICNDKNLGMNHLPKRYTSTLGLVRSHWNIFLRKAYLCIALQMKHYIIISHKRIIFSGISTPAYRGHFYQPSMLCSSVH